MSKKDHWIAADGTTGQKEPHILESGELNSENQLAIQRLILKLTYRSYNILDKIDITNLATLIRSTNLSKDAKSIFTMIENNKLDCREIRHLIAQEYGISEDY